MGKTFLSAALNGCCQWSWWGFWKNNCDDNALSAASWANINRNPWFGEW